MHKQFKVGDLIICTKHFCDGNNDCIRETEIGQIYNMDDYPQFIYADFSHHKGIAISQIEQKENIKKLNK